MWMFLIVVLTILFGYVAFYKPLTYWKRHGVQTMTIVPIFGNLYGSVLRLKTLKDVFIDMYNAHPKNRCTGIYFFHKPILIIRDPELVKIITIKEFDHFMDHTEQFFRSDLDSVISKNLFSLKGKKWKNMRATLSPAFTSSKMRGIFNLISECGDQMTKYFKNEIKNQKDSILEVEMKDLATRFSNDVIATTAFGIQVDSFTQKDNVFYRMGKKATDFKLWRILCGHLFPFLMKIFNQGVVPESVCKYFGELVLETIQTREKQNIVRPDMIQILMEAKKGALKHEEDNENENSSFAAVNESNIGKSNDKIELTDEDIIAQAFIFFIAGFESVSGALCFTAHEITVNPDVQQRVQEEIDDLLNESNGKLTYEGLNKLKYLDMVISESLRKWPPAPNSDRICTKEFTFTENDGSVITVEKDTNILIPFYGFHYDPKYFPDPEKFDPERFSEENKHNIKPLTYFPFGVGPRNCIGSRFALMEVKIALVYFLSNFDFVVIKNTQIPLKLSKTASKIIAEKGFNIGLKFRN